MTVPSSSTRGTAAGNGVATTFNFNFTLPARHADDMVFTYVDTDGVEATLDNDADITIDVDNNQFSFPKGGSSYSTLATGEKIVYRMVTPNTQGADLPNQGGVFLEEIEKALDDAAFRDQTLQEQIDRAVKIPVSSTVSPEDYLTTVGGYKDAAEAAQAAAEAAQAASEAAQAAAEAAQAASETAQGLAEAAQAAAETAQGLAETAQAAAESAKDDAEAAWASISPYAADITTLAAISADVTAAAAIAADITAAAANGTDISAVADAIAAINTVAANIASVIDAANNIPKHNLAATAAPTVNDDSGDGYQIGSVWVDTTNKHVYVCTDASSGAAVWNRSDFNILQTCVVSGVYGSVSDKDYTIFLEAPYAGTITSITTQSESGTCTLTGKIDGVALGGTANSVSTSKTTQNHSSSNTFTAGQKISITVSSNSTCVGLQWQIIFTRNIA